MEVAARSVLAPKREEKHSSAETRSETRKGSACSAIGAQTAEACTSCTGFRRLAAVAVAAVEQADKEM